MAQVFLRWRFFRLVPGMLGSLHNSHGLHPFRLHSSSSLQRKAAIRLHPSNCSSYYSSRCSALPGKKTSTMASADSCHLSLLSRTGLPLRLDDRSPQVRTLTFPAFLSHLLDQPLVASGFVVCSQLTLPHSLSLGLCSSSHRFASSFLRTSPHGDALAFR